MSWIVGSGRENSSLYMTVRASILENQSSDMMAELGVIRRGERDHARQNSQTTTFESQQSMNLEGQEGRRCNREQPDSLGMFAMKPLRSASDVLALLIVASTKRQTL